MNKYEIYLQLFKQHHILHFNKQLVVTNKFHRDFSLQEMQEAAKQQQLALTPTSTTLPAPTVPTTTYNFKKFILDCDVPEKLHLGTGGFYWANRYNAKADKVFQKMMKTGEVKYDVLVIATKLYYKSGGARVTISNFILEGIWESFYDQMVTEIEKGTAEKHIKKNLSEGDSGFSRYS